FQAEDGIRDPLVTGVQTCALPISGRSTPSIDVGDSRLPKSFDRDLYLTLNPDVAASGLDPVLHYLNYGIREARLYTLSDEVLRRSEEHTSELQSRVDLVCRLLLEK